MVQLERYTTLDIKIQREKEVEENIGEDISGLKAFSEWVHNFCDMHNIVRLQYSSDFESIIKLSIEEIANLQPSISMAYSVAMLNYAAYLQEKIDYLSAKIKWCEATLHYSYGKHWDKYDKFIQGDIKKSLVVNSDDFLSRVYSVNVRLTAARDVLIETNADIKRRSSVFLELGKIRSYENR